MNTVEILLIISGIVIVGLIVALVLVLTVFKQDICKKEEKFVNIESEDYRDFGGNVWNVMKCQGTSDNCSPVPSGQIFDNDVIWNEFRRTIIHPNFPEVEQYLTYQNKVPFQIDGDANIPNGTLQEQLRRMLYNRSCFDSNVSSMGIRGAFSRCFIDILPEPVRLLNVIKTHMQNNMLYTSNNTISYRATPVIDISRYEGSIRLFLNNIRDSDEVRDLCEDWRDTYKPQKGVSTVCPKIYRRDNTVIFDEFRRSIIDTNFHILNSILGYTNKIGFQGIRTDTLRNQLLDILLDTKCNDEANILDRFSGTVPYDTDSFLECIEPQVQTAVRLMTTINNIYIEGRLRIDIDLMTLSRGDPIIIPEKEPIDYKKYRIKSNEKYVKFPQLPSMDNAEYTENILESDVMSLHRIDPSGNSYTARKTEKLILLSSGTLNDLAVGWGTLAENPSYTPVMFINMGEQELEDGDSVIPSDTQGNWHICIGNKETGICSMFLGDETNGSNVGYTQSSENIDISISMLRINLKEKVHTWEVVPV